MGILKWLLGGGHGMSHGTGQGRSKHGYNKHANYPNINEQVDQNGQRCRKCNTVNLINAKFCQQCGNSLGPERCTECQSVLSAGSKFCSQCGKTVE